MRPWRRLCLLWRVSLVPGDAHAYTSTHTHGKHTCGQIKRKRAHRQADTKDKDTFTHTLKANKHAHKHKRQTHTRRHKRRTQAQKADTTSKRRTQTHRQTHTHKKKTNTRTYSQRQILHTEAYKDEITAFLKPLNSFLISEMSNTFSGQTR